MTAVALCIYAILIVGILAIGFLFLTSGADQ